MTKEEILEIMKTEKDLYELNINGFDCIIYRFKGHLNGYVSLLKEGYEDLDTNELEVHGGITYQGNLKDLMIQGLTKDYSDNKFIGFDTAHAGDAFIYEGFEHLFLKGEYRDYNYVYNELKELTNQLNNKPGLKVEAIKDSQRYLESFIQEVTDFRDLTTMEFYIKYCVWKDEEIKEQYHNYLLSEQAGDTDTEDILSYNEWLEEVYYEENQYKIEDNVREYREPSLDCVVYKEVSGHNDYKIYELTLAWGGPNIYINLSSRWHRATYEFYWGGDNLKEDLSYLYDEIFNYLNLDAYDY